MASPSELSVIVTGTSTAGSTADMVIPPSAGRSL